jgi:predicted nucleotidyltransferase
MQMSLMTLSSIKKDLKKLLTDKKVYDVILFGSFIKGKSLPADIDVALITDLKEDFELEGYHISLVSPTDFFSKNVPSVITTLFKEGYSLKKNQFFSENYGFANTCLFNYELKSLNNSEKVTVVSNLRGKSNEKGLVLEKGGSWISRNVFTCPISEEYLFEQFFIYHKIKFKKSYCLMH